MKVYVFPSDLGGCGHYRMIWPAEELQRQGYDVVLQRPKERQDISAEIDNETDTVIGVSIPDDADVLVFQRVTHKYLAQAISIIRNRGVAVVIDMDDDLSAIDPANPAFNAMHPRNAQLQLMGAKSSQGEHTWLNARHACDRATLVTLSTEALRDVYGRRAPHVVIHNSVHDQMLTFEHHDSDLFGYAGAVITHRGDVEKLGFAVAELMRDGFKFATIGEDVDIEKILGLPRDVDQPFGPAELRDWPRTLTQLGVGLAPLADTRFNRGKSWLKPLEYAAVGVPCVMSPSPEYRRIYELGVGVLAKKPNDFYRKTRQLLTDAKMRCDLSETCRGVAAQHTISQYAERWWAAWTHAYDIQQSS